MDRAIIYLFADSSWMYACEYSHGFHKEKGVYHEIVISKGWDSREVSIMVRDYFSENSENIF